MFERLRRIFAKGRTAPLPERPEYSVPVLAAVQDFEPLTRRELYRAGWRRAVKKRVDSQLLAVADYYAAVVGGAPVRRFWKRFVADKARRRKWLDWRRRDLLRALHSRQAVWTTYAGVDAIVKALGTGRFADTRPIYEALFGPPLEPPTPFPDAAVCACFRGRCRWFRGISLAPGRGFGEWACEGFPYGIPDSIVDGRHDHTERHKGDRGFRYAPANP